MRVAFGLIGGSQWTGGINYLVNLLSAIHENENVSIEPVLFAGLNVSQNDLDLLKPYIVEPVIVSDIWDKGSFKYKIRLFQSLVFQRDFIAEKAYKNAEIDIVFQHSAWYGWRFKVPTLAWIADFQHKYLPELFSKPNYWRREIGYKALSYAATSIMISSETAKIDCENYYPSSKDKTKVLKFAVRINPEIIDHDLNDIRLKYNLPEKYIYLPNQFWKHKNHYRVVEALEEIKNRGCNIKLAVSGALKDNRNADYPQSVIDKVKKSSVEDQFLYLGMIPFEDILPLMRSSVAVLNPSLFEGWSTTVEEAKAINAPLILSNLAVHKEQAKHNVVFFDPLDVSSIADKLIETWDNCSISHSRDDEINAIEKCVINRKHVAVTFDEICQSTIASFDS